MDCIWYLALYIKDTNNRFNLVFICVTKKIKVLDYNRYYVLPCFSLRSIWYMLYIIVLCILSCLVLWVSFFLYKIQYWLSYEIRNISILYFERYYGNSYHSYLIYYVIFQYEQIASFMTKLNYSQNHMVEIYAKKEL